jgi:beta-N-acetylhexosaminidase
VTRADRTRAAAWTLACLLLAACTSFAGTGAAPRTSGATTSSAPPSASPTPDPTAQVDAVLAGLDPRSRVAQLFVVGVPLSNLGAADQLLAQNVGGIFLAGRSTVSATDLAAVTAQWAARNPALRPWVALDQEGGQVQTLSGPGFPRLPSAHDQAALPPDRLSALADGMGASLSAAGVNLNLAPVADVVPAGTEAGNAPIGAFGRQYGSTPGEVLTNARTVVNALADHGVTATLKHFPGLGRVRQNTDNAASVVDSVTTADDGQVALFGTLCALPSAPFVMASSAIYSRIDPNSVAMFSPAVVTDLLRQRLGCGGVVISDDVSIATAVAGVPAGDRAVRFLAAGGTLVLIAHADPLPQMIDAVLARAAADPSFAAQIQAAERTALQAKLKAGLLKA